MPSVKPSFPRLRRDGHWSVKGLVAHYPFYERAGDILHDIAGNNDGTLTNMDPATDWVTGEMGAALDSNGTDQHISVPTAIGQSKSNVSALVWFHLSGVSLSGAFFKIGSVASVDRGYALGVGTNTFDADGNDLIGLEEGTAWLDTNHAIGTGWHSAAHIRDANSEHDLYLDGQFIQHFANVSSKGITVDDAQIAGYAARHFPGLIALVTFYARALSATEVAWLRACPNIVYEPGGMPWLGAGAPPPATLTLTDGLALADASTLGVRMSFADGAGAADTMGPRPGLSFADAATWADLLAALSPALALTEDASLADLLGAQGLDLQLADDATAADALAALRPALSPTDAVGLADTLANPALGLALLDALGLADLPSLRPYLAAVDAVTWADSLTALRPALALADDATAADTLTFAELAELVLTDGVGVADSLSALRVALTLADALGAGDSLRVMPVLALADQVTLADGAVLGVGIYLVDLLGAAETITLRPALAFADGIRLTDALTFPLIWAEGIESEGRLALATILSEGRLALAYIDSEGRLAIKTFNSDAT